MTDETELQAAPGFVSEEVAEELPGLRLDWITVRGRRRSSPRPVVQRLAALSNTYRGARAVALRAQPIPRAYRTFFRQIGLDPDVDRIPIEDAVVGRLFHGAFRSRDLIDDALLIALVETGVGVWALDAALVAAGGLGIRTSFEGERLGSSEIGNHLQGGRLVVADAEHTHALLFGEIARGHEVTHRTERIALFTVAVDGVPAIHLEEALWVCTEVLAAVPD